MMELKEIILELDDVLEGLIPIEERKLSAAANYNVVELEECMKREQAAVLQIRGLDQKREAWLAQKGWSDKSFRQILEFLPGEERGQLEPSFERMTENFRMFHRLRSQVKKRKRAECHLSFHMNPDIFRYCLTVKGKCSQQIQERLPELILLMR